MTAIKAYRRANEWKNRKGYDKIQNKVTQEAKSVVLHVARELAP
jgi:hypothetical protein